MNKAYIYAHFLLGLVFGSIIACSPTKFGQNQQVISLCSEADSCVTSNGFTEITQNHKIGSGKIDILFINDNSASMSKNQLQMASKFSGFIQSLDGKNIDYRIAITTTDLNSVLKDKLITFGNGKKYITKSDTDRISLFNNAIVRNETIRCEDFIIGMFNTYGVDYQSNLVNPSYASQYSSKCPSSDTRGIYTANLVVSANSDSFLRSDANLNVILISNDDVRQGNSMEPNDRASSFISMMGQMHPNKYWDFNSIIVKDITCKQAQTLKNAVNQIVPNINGGLGIEYANLSNSVAKDIDGNPRPRGQILDICQSDYSQHFRSMYTQIAEESRMLSLRCTPEVEPTVFVSGSPGSIVNYRWEGDKIIFDRSEQGKSVTISYKCYTGPT